jgi:hypothetical protein
MAYAFRTGPGTDYRAKPLHDAEVRPNSLAIRYNRCGGLPEPTIRLAHSQTIGNERSSSMSECRARGPGGLPRVVGDDHVRPLPGAGPDQLHRPVTRRVPDWRGEPHVIHRGVYHCRRRWPIRSERGDVPGWVLITIMTAGICRRERLGRRKGDRRQRPVGHYW